MIMVVLNLLIGMG